MRLGSLVKTASNKENFTELEHYVDFCREFLAFIAVPGAIQAEIVSRNENHYRFIQFKNQEFSISRPKLKTALHKQGRKERRGWWNWAAFCEKKRR
jgi:hypothetical protein